MPRPPGPARWRPGTLHRPEGFLPAPDSDFYRIEDTLSPEERAILTKVRAARERCDPGC